MRPSFVPFAGLHCAGALVATIADLDTSYQALREAVSKKDAAEVKKLATEVHALVHAAVASPAPAKEAEKDAWNKLTTYTREVDL
jgi:hypothetical protein